MRTEKTSDARDWTACMHNVYANPLHLNSHDFGTVPTRNIVHMHSPFPSHSRQIRRVYEYETSIFHTSFAPSIMIGTSMKCLHPHLVLLRRHHDGGSGAQTLTTDRVGRRSCYMYTRSHKYISNHNDEQVQQYIHKIWNICGRTKHKPTYIQE